MFSSFTASLKSVGCRIGAVFQRKRQEDEQSATPAETPTRQVPQSGPAKHNSPTAKNNKGPAKNVGSEKSIEDELKEVENAVDRVAQESQDYVKKTTTRSDADKYLHDKERFLNSGPQSSSPSSTKFAGDKVVSSGKTSWYVKEEPKEFGEKKGLQMFAEETASNIDQSVKDGKQHVQEKTTQSISDQILQSASNLGHLGHQEQKALDIETTGFQDASKLIAETKTDVSTKGFTTNFEVFRTNVPDLGTSTKDKTPEFEDAEQTIADLARTERDEAGAIISNLAQSFQGEKDEIEDFYTADGFKEQTHDFPSKVFQKVPKDVSDNVSEKMDSFGKSLMDKKESVSETLQNTASSIGQSLHGQKEYLKEFGEDLGKSAKSKKEDLQKTIEKTSSNVEQSLRDKNESICESLQKSSSSIGQSLQTKKENLNENVERAKKSAKENLTDFEKEAQVKKNEIAKGLEETTSNVSQIFTHLGQSAEDNAHAMADSLQDSASNIGRSLEENKQKMDKSLKSTSEHVAERAQKKKSDISDSLSHLAKSAEEKQQSIEENLRKKAENKQKNIQSSTIGQSLDQTASKLSDSATTEKKKTIADTLSENLLHLGEASSAKRQQFGEDLRETASNVAQFASGAKKSLSETLKTNTESASDYFDRSMSSAANFLQSTKKESKEEVEDDANLLTTKTSKLFHK